MWWREPGKRTIKYEPTGKERRDTYPSTNRTDPLHSGAGITQARSTETKSNSVPQEILGRWGGGWAALQGRGLGELAHLS